MFQPAVSRSLIPACATLHTLTLCICAICLALKVSASEKCQIYMVTRKLVLAQFCTIFPFYPQKHCSTFCVNVSSLGQNIRKSFYLDCNMFDVSFPAFSVFTLVQDCIWLYTTHLAVSILRQLRW